MSVVPRDYLAVRKSDEHIKTPSGFAHNKSLFSTTHLSSCQENWVDSVRQIETKCHEENESRERPWIFFHVFFCSSNMCPNWGSSRTDSRLGVRPLFGGRFQMGAATFGLHIVVFGVLFCLYLAVSSCQITIFMFSISRPLLTAFPFKYPSANQNSLSIRCWYVLTRAFVITSQLYDKSFQLFLHII